MYVADGCYWDATDERPRIKFVTVVLIAIVQIQNDGAQPSAMDKVVCTAHRKSHKNTATREQQANTNRSAAR